MDEFKKKINKTKPKSNELFNFGDRKIGIIHAKLRMGCSQLNSDLYKMGLVESPLCSCGDSSEDAFHFFFQCNKYVLQRNDLQTKITPSASFNIKTVLFGTSTKMNAKNKDIFNAVHYYIKATGRFNV